MGGFALTNPGIQYEDQQPMIDPQTGQPMPVAPRVQFFKNSAARNAQFVHDLNSAAPPTLEADENGNIGPSAQNLPKMANPSFRQLASPNPQTGEEQPISSGETKLGKLLHILGSAARGAAMGAGQPNFGAGFEQAQVRPLQIASMRQGLQQQQAQTALTRSQSTMVPTPYGPMPAGLAKAMFPALINAGSREKVQGMKGNTALDVAQLKTDSAETIAQNKLGGTAPHTINTPQGTLQWDADAKNYKKIADAAPQGKMGSVAPEIYAQLGAPPVNDPEKLRAWGAAAEKIKNDEAALLGNARGQAYGAYKPVQVINPDTGDLQWMYAGQAVNSAAAPAAEGAKTMSKQQQFQEMHYASQQARNAINGLDRPFSSAQVAKLTLAMSHSDPTVRNNEISTLLGTQQLTPAQEDFVVWINQLNERALSLRNVAGMGQGAQDLRAAIQNTLPGIRSGSKDFALKQLNAFENQVNLLEKGIPKVKNPNNAPPKKFSSTAERDKALGVVYAH